MPFSRTIRPGGWRAMDRSSSQPATNPGNFKSEDNIKHRAMIRLR